MMRIQSERHTFTDLLEVFIQQQKRENQIQYLPMVVRTVQKHGPDEQQVNKWCFNAWACAIREPNRNNSLYFA